MHGLSASFPLPPRTSPSASDIALELSTDDGPHDTNLSQAYSHARMRHELRQDELDDLDQWLTSLVMPQRSALSPREELRQ